MKKRLMVIGLAILFMLTSVVTCYAATETDVTLKLSKTEVKAGETFTVTLSATCPDGINGVVTTYSYDATILEYVSESVPNDNYAFGGNKEEKEIFVYCTSTDSIQEADVYTLTFKVKDGAEANTTTQISITEATLDSDAATDSEHIIPAQDVTIKVVSDEETPGKDEGETNPPTDGENGEQNPPTDGENGEQNPPASEGTGNENPPSSIEQKPGENPPTTEGTTIVVGDDTVSDKDIPKAGISTIIVFAIVAVALIAIVVYRKNKELQDIK